MRHHFPSFIEMMEKMPASLFNPGAAVWIIVGAIVGFFIGNQTMLRWADNLFSDAIQATIYLPPLLIAFAGIGMSFGISLHRAWDHRRAKGEVVRGGGERKEPMPSLKKKEEKEV